MIRHWETSANCLMMNLYFCVSNRIRMVYLRYRFYNESFLYKLIHILCKNMYGFKLKLLCVMKSSYLQRSCTTANVATARQRRQPYSHVAAVPALFALPHSLLLLRAAYC